MDQRKLNSQLLKDHPSTIVPKFKKFSLLIFIILTLFNTWLRRYYHFSTSTYQNTPRSFTVVDYGIIVSLLIIGFLYIMQKRTQLYFYFKKRFVVFEIFYLFYVFLGFYPTSSYIFYSWHFPLHDYLFPPVMPIGNLVSMLSSAIQYGSLYVFLNSKAYHYEALEKHGYF